MKKKSDKVVPITKCELYEELDDLKVHIPTPRFPVEVLPPQIIKLCTCVSEAMCLPLDFVGVSTLAAAAHFIGPKRRLVLKNGWAEYANIWVCLIGEPGDGKTPAMAAAMKPIEAKQRKLREQYKQALKSYKRRYKKWIESGRDGDEPIKPSRMQAYTTDATIEAFIDCLKKSPHGLILEKDEFASFVLSMNQYKAGKGDDRQKWLTLWSMRPIIVNRKSLEEPLEVDIPFVNILGGIQPAKLPELLKAELGTEDGFIDRILYSNPDSVPVTWNEVEIPKPIEDAYQSLLEAIEHLPARDITWSPGAKQLFVQWRSSHDTAIQNVSPELSRYFTKTRSYFARLALILHCLRVAAGLERDEHISEETLLGTLELIEYFLDNAKKVFESLDQSDMDRKAEKFLRWLKKRGGSASTKETCKSQVAGIKHTNMALQLFQYLENKGVGTIIREPAGKRIRVTFTMNSTKPSPS